MIYFVQDSLSLRIKIGFTADKDPEARMRALQTGCPGKLVLLATFPGDEQFEARLHDRFRDAREQGEWFRPVPALIGCILEQQQGLIEEMREWGKKAVGALESEEQRRIGLAEEFGVCLEKWSELCDRQSAHHWELLQAHEAQSKELLRLQSSRGPAAIHGSGKPLDAAERLLPAFS